MSTAGALILNRILLQRIPAPQHDPDDVDRTIDRILARQEFLPPERTWLRRQWDRLVDWLRSLLESSNDAPAPDLPTEPAQGGGAGSLVAILLLALVVALAVWVIVRIVRDRTPRADGGDDDSISIEIDEYRTAADWRSRAARLEGAGQSKEAVRAWLRWGIATLVDREVLEDVPGRTTGEYRRFVAERHPHLQSRFDRATMLFDEIWYADRDATAESVSTIRQDMEAVVEASSTRGQTRGPDPRRPLAEIT